MTVPGGNPLNYPPNSQLAIKRVQENRAPSSGDYKNFREGDEWLDKSSDDWYKLADISAQTATWVKIGGTSAAVETFIPDSGTSPVVPTASNQITTTGSNGITVVGGTSTLTFDSANGQLATKFLPDSGTSPVIPDSAGEVTTSGGNGIEIVGSANTLTSNMQSPYTGDFAFQSNTSADTQTLTIENTSDTATSAAEVLVKVAGSSASNPQLTLDIDSVQQYSLGIDNADSDILKISSGTVLGTNDLLTIDSSGDFTFSSTSSSVTNFDFINDDNSQTELRVANPNAGASAGANLTATVNEVTAGDPVVKWVVANGPTTFTAGIDNDALDVWQLSAQNGLGANVAIEVETNQQVNFPSTESILVPAGTTAERPGTPVNGMIRYNSDDATFEGYEDGSWVNIGAGESGVTIQQASVTSTTQITLPMAATIPLDGTIPQISEGTQIFSLAFTPLNAASNLILELDTLLGDGSAGSNVVIAIFEDAGVNAIYSSTIDISSPASQLTSNLRCRFIVSAASTSARTYTVRAGGSTALDWQFNPNAAFGAGNAFSSFTVTEVTP